MRVAQEKPAVIIGRCGSYILRNHPKHVSVFLHADIEFRKQNVQEYYGVSAKDAAKLIVSADKSRTRYIHEFTGCDMNDVRKYHLSIDTGVLGLDGTVNLMSDYIKNRFRNVELKSIDECTAAENFQ
ncbi:AAA family ATPase [Dehalococcoides sp.]|uniref:cytidylate kinase-like family protein n=1 Tax=Dehalococcoides sp. TaxID=1966486 RepID=UPI003A0FC0C0